jgi:hypothetical protein
MTQNMDDCELEFNFKNPYHNLVLSREQFGWDERYRDLGFKDELPKFYGTLQVEGSIDWLHEVERIFYYKEVLDCIKVKRVPIKLMDRASVWWDQFK